MECMKAQGRRDGGSNVLRRNLRDNFRSLILEKKAHLGPQGPWGEGRGRSKLRGTVQNPQGKKKGKMTPNRKNRKN